jgi:Cof subfamily protein (haloacid dehalogenase superfamily)
MLCSDMTLSERNQAALSACVDRGIHVLVATGRAISSIPQNIKDFPGIRYFITANGAKIYDATQTEPLYAKYLSGEAVESVWSLIADPKIMIEVFVDGQPYIDARMYDDLAAYGVPDYFQEYVRSTRRPKDDITAFVRAHIAEIENINFNYPDETVRGTLYERLSGSALYTLTSSLPFNLEIGGLGVNKADALEFMCRRLGVLQQETLSVGDNYNDIEMIEYAAVGVAMGDAVPAAKAAANFITLGNDQSGVAYALERVAL